jgi:aspartate/methionine/tyrosine aminotransferase
MSLTDSERSRSSVNSSAQQQFVADVDVQASLTRHEWSGLASRFNLADGHARQAQSPNEAAVVEDLTRIFKSAEAVDQRDVQHAFEEAFYVAAGQPSVLRRAQWPLHHYSSSLSTEVVANYLREEASRVALLHPTFDNIAAILRRHDVPLQPMTEDIFDCPDDPRLYEGWDVLFLVVPNNPTGADPRPEVMRAIADNCEARGRTLVLDVSFRVFSRYLSTWDQYAYFESIGLNHIGIEDTGKTWPTLDLKLGSLIADADLHPPLLRITDDCLLNVSPFIFSLLRRYIEAEGRPHCVRVGNVNRSVLERQLMDGPAQVLETKAPMSVAWLRLPASWRSSEVCPWLSGEGIGVLPGGPFFWANPDQGERYLRVALMRPETEFAEGAQALGAALRRYPGAH